MIFLDYQDRRPIYEQIDLDASFLRIFPVAKCTAGKPRVRKNEAAAAL